jgi:hypothetical protein
VLISKRGGMLIREENATAVREWKLLAKKIKGGDAA